MSFSDLMESGRGPGVIGTLLALVVLGGFGVLFLLAFNETPPSEKITVQTQIADQAKELDAAAAEIAQQSRKLENLPKLEATALKLRKAKRDIATIEGRVDSATSALAAARQQLADCAAEFEHYKDRYREVTRLAAKDEKIAKLQTQSGKTYDDVLIREVTPIGIQIRHQGGFARIPFEDLPAAMQNRFQFDPKQKNAAIAEENARRKDHDSSVAASLTETKQQQEARKQADAAAHQLEASRAIALKTAQLTALDGEINRLLEELRHEQTKKFRRTQPLASKIADKQKLRVQLQAEVAQLRAGL